MRSFTSILLLAVLLASSRAAVTPAAEMDEVSMEELEMFEELNTSNQTLNQTLVDPMAAPEDLPDMNERETDQSESPRSRMSGAQPDARSGTSCSTRNNLYWLEGTGFSLKPQTQDGHYFDNENCYYRFYSPSGTRVKASCHYAYLAPGDYLQFHGGLLSSSVKVERYRRSFSYTSRRNYLSVKFYSSRVIRGRGFSCYVRAI